jgi:C4-dicarboxylate-specific signal transduction histidine kinase
VRDKDDPRVRLKVEIASRELVARARDERPDLPEGAFVAMNVTDNGAGIDPAILEQLFEPFFTTKESVLPGTAPSTAPGRM